MIRKVSPTDTEAIREIYNHYVINSTATFDTEPLSASRISRLISDISTRYPYLVYEEDEKVRGYCYAHPWKERAAYGKTLETTVYISGEYQGKGIGRMLMAELIQSCRQQGYHALIACITADNEPSKTLHTKLGFRQVSLFKQVGIKFGRLFDIADYELLLS